MSQGNSCPDQISTINLRVAADDALLTDLYATAMRMSPRTRIRIDPTSTHEYSASVHAPTAPPHVPWALHLTDSDHQYKLLAFDFDTGTHGPTVAHADAGRLAHELTELGVRHLRTTSGPTGGQHLWVTLSEAADPAEVKTLAHALSAHYPSLDISALCNPITGAVRGPGAPHRSGGYALPSLRGRALSEALAAMRAGTPTDVLGWLLARHPHTTPPASAGIRSTPVRVVDTAEGPRLDRPRRPLSARTKLLMATPLSEDCDRSAVAFSILLGMARSGRTLTDVETALTAPGLIRLREDKNTAHAFTLAKQWDRALSAAATFAPAAVEDVPRADELDERLGTIADALHRHSAMFARPGGPSDERILHALVQLARTARTTTLDIDCRRLAQATGLDASTVSRRLRALEASAWISQVHAGSGTKGATWKLHQPPTEYCTGATQGIHAPGLQLSDELLTHHAHDLWTPAPGLGPAYARIHLYLTFGIHDSGELAVATGYSIRTVESAKRVFTRLRLLPTSRSTDQTRRLQLHTAAQQIGVSGVLAARALRHVTERELFAWWTDEQEWRRRPGKKRRSGPRRYASGAIALPIETTPRGRYGRFPTIGGRADYATARRIVTDYQSPRRTLAA